MGNPTPKKREKQYNMQGMYTSVCGVELKFTFITWPGLTKEELKHRNVSCYSIYQQYSSSNTYSTGTYTVHTIRTVLHTYRVQVNQNKDYEYEYINA